MNEEETVTFVKNSECEIQRLTALPQKQVMRMT